jgi:tetratricopeptide (TPR) repeat protein
MMRVAVAFFLIMAFNVPAAQAVYTPDPAPAPAATAAPKPSEATKSVQSELSRISTMLNRKDYKRARAELRRIDRAFPNNADVNNLLGYTSRKLQLYASSATYYRKALSIDPNHLDALEYQGELFVATKKRALAKRNLVKLERLCGVDCSQYKDLKRVLDKKK